MELYSDEVGESVYQSNTYTQVHGSHVLCLYPVPPELSTNHLAQAVWGPGSIILLILPQKHLRANYNHGALPPVLEPPGVTLQSPNKVTQAPISGTMEILAPFLTCLRISEAWN